MRKKVLSFAMVLYLGLPVFTSCESDDGKADRRSRNLEQAMLLYLAPDTEAKYAGLSNVSVLEDGRVQAEIIYLVKDSLGDDVVHSARVITDNDCSEVLGWDELNPKDCGEDKRMGSGKFERNDANMDGSLVDALFELKKNR